MARKNPIKNNDKQTVDQPLDPSRRNLLSEGGSHFACGSNAGFTDPRQCKLRTMCELNQTTETILYKD